MVHLAPEEFALLQLAGEVLPWEGLTYEGSPRWWTTHWNEDGHYLCTCGAVDKEPKTL